MQLFTLHTTLSSCGKNVTRGTDGLSLFSKKMWLKVCPFCHCSCRLLLCSDYVPERVRAGRFFDAFASLTCSEWQCGRYTETRKKVKQTNHVWQSQTYHIRRSRIYHNRIKANLRGQPVAEIPSEVRSTETSELSCGQSRRLRLRMIYHVAQQHIILLRSKRQYEYWKTASFRKLFYPPLFIFKS